MELVYTVAFLVGLGYGALSVLLHGVADVLHGTPEAGSHHVDGHGGDHGAHAGPSPFSPLTIATFLLGFGALGLIGMRGLGFGFAAGLGFATAGALIVAFLFFFLVLRTLYGFQSSSVVRADALRDAVGEVTTAIPSGGTGEITVVVGGGLMQLPARAADGADVARGTRVVTVEIRDGIAYVAPLLEESASVTRLRDA